MLSQSCCQLPFCLPELDVNHTLCTSTLMQCSLGEHPGSLADATAPTPDGVGYLGFIGLSVLWLPRDPLGTVG
jgi:hypothetical protein